MDTAPDFVTVSEVLVVFVVLELLTTDEVLAEFETAEEEVCFFFVLFEVVPDLFTVILRHFWSLLVRKKLVNYLNKKKLQSLTK